MKVHELHKSKGSEKQDLALIIVSTSRFEEQEKGFPSSDKTIPAVKELLINYPSINLKFTSIIPDSKEHLKEIFDVLINREDLDALIFSGGTGLSPTDVTYESITPHLQKEIQGFGELFRYLSFKEIGSSAMLSRAAGGIHEEKAIFILPGSPNAVKLALNELILPELGHIAYLIQKEK